MTADEIRAEAHRLVCGRQDCDAEATRYIEFHSCLETTALPPHLTCGSCLRDLRRTFEHGRAIECPACGMRLATFNQFVPVAEEVG